MPEFPALIALFLRAGKLHTRPLLSRVAQYLVSLHLPAVLGLIIAIAMVGVVVGCVLYRTKTRHQRMIPAAP